MNRIRHQIDPRDAGDYGAVADADLLRPIHTAAVCSAIALLGTKSVTPRKHGQVTLSAMAEVRFRLEYDKCDS